MATTATKTTALAGITLNIRVFEYHGREFVGVEAYKTDPVTLKKTEEIIVLDEASIMGGV